MLKLFKYGLKLETAFLFYSFLLSVNLTLFTIILVMGNMRLWMTVIYLVLFAELGYKVFRGWKIIRAARIVCEELTASIFAAAALPIDSGIPLPETEAVEDNVISMKCPPHMWKVDPDGGNICVKCSIKPGS